MSTTIYPLISMAHESSKPVPSLINKFLSWCTAQQQNRLFWLGFALTAHGCILTPVTIIAIVLSGTNMVLFVAAIVAMGMSLIPNLAALPTKITIPVFVLSILADIMIIIICAFIGFNIANTYI